jgi:predicted acylesterase/phospholipase RssA
LKTKLDTEPIPPGDDVCPAPAPVDEEPPVDRFCDLVLTGGVASGVVYPWAIVELARAYRFRNIGGTSVGAMAAALAAAAEYGRRNGFDAAFEPLRRLPAGLGEVLPDGRTRMLSLFQSHPRGARLLRIWGRLGRGRSDEDREPRTGGMLTRAVFEFVRAYALPVGIGAALGAALAWLASDGAHWLGTAALVGLLATLGAVLALAWALWSDIQHGVIDNGLGLCKGGTLEPQPPGAAGRTPGLCEWLHEGIQRSAGLSISDPPLTFRDLWNAPAYPGAASGSCGDDDPQALRSINLLVLTTNVTHGRPYRLPLTDRASRLFFKPEELKDYFPAAVLNALVAKSRPYQRRSGHANFNSDPEPSDRTAPFLEVPRADLPLVVAARLSLSYPLLFSAVPLWAIDYEQPVVALREIRRCQFTDGGASSNFPIHLFDAALPRWPTFGMWLDRRSPYEHDRDGESSNEVWLPKYQGQGHGDNWRRFDPEAAARPPWPYLAPGCRSRAKLLSGYLLAIATGAVDWRDRTSFRLPHVRNRVARLLLRRGEGGLNIGMGRRQILLMAHRYGTAAGRLFVDRFAEQPGGRPSLAWSEQRWVHLQLLIGGLRERLAGLSASASAGVNSTPMPAAIQHAVSRSPIRDLGVDKRIEQMQADSLDNLLAELQQLEALLRDAGPQTYRPVPEPELRLRAPL